jgi:hypothetical protein
MPTIPQLDQQIKELRKQKRKLYTQSYYRTYYLESKRIDMELSSLTPEQKVKLLDHIQTKYTWCKSKAR